MTTRGRAVLHVALSDLRRRARSPTYLVVGLLTATLALTLTGGDVQLTVGGGYTGEPTAAWMGALVATTGTLVLVLVGYSLVRGRILADAERGVGQLVATTATGDATYLAGRWLGYFATLTAVTAVLALATLGAFLRRGTGPLDLWALWSPFLFLTLPAMAAVAAVAVWFETTRLLRGTFGTVVYFVGVMTLFLAGLNPATLPLDPTGAGVVRESMLAAIPETVTGGARYEFAIRSATAATTFTWSGVDWTPGTLAGRLPLLGFSVLALGAATVSFDRFSDRRGLRDRLRAALPVGESGGAGQTGADSEAPTVPGGTEPGGHGGPGTVEADAAVATATGFDLAPVTVGSPSLLDPRVLLAELRMALRDRRWWWYLALAGVVLAGLLAPTHAARGFVLPLAVLLGLPVWAGLGTRAVRHRTEQLVGTTPRPLGQFLATLASGVAVALLAASGVLVSLAVAGETGALAAALAGVAFVPSLALALGTWARTRRAFEITVLILWYLGPVNGATPLDFLGSTSVATGRTLAYGAAIVVLVGVALAGRAWRGRRR